ncbi:MAG: metalloenzyme [Myxococcaceae bacterium]
MRVALLFIDGIGVGRPDPDHNPLARGEYLLSRFDDGSGAPLPGGGAFVDVDTTFDVPGRPQSASNQTAIFTGLPAPRLIGRHVLGYPDAPLRELILSHSVVKRLVASGRTATFANAYPAGYLDALKLRRRPSEKPDVVIPERALRRIRPSATTLSMSAADVALRTLDDARSDRALTNCIDGVRARERGFSVPERTPEEAAEILWSLDEDFVLFEHYLADEAGHAQDGDCADQVLETFDRFARAVVAKRPEGAHILVCSDHGNVEDLSTRSHTLNRVPVLYFGPRPTDVVPHLRDVADVGRAVLRLMDLDERDEART